MAGTRETVVVSYQLRSAYQSIGEGEFVRNSGKAMELNERFRDVTGELPFFL